MLQALLVTFREGIESFLIVGVVIAYLKKTERGGLVRGVYAGLAIAAVASVIGAYLWLQVPNQPLYEAIAAFSASLIVGWFLIQMTRVGRKMRGEIETRVERMAGNKGAPASARALVGVALVTALLVTRELLEAVFYLGVQAMAVRAAEVRAQAILVATGAGLGLLTAGVVAWAWTRYGSRLNLGVILKVTALFLGLFLIQLVIYGVHELAESGVIQGSQGFHDATEVFGPDGPIGHVLSYSLLGAPLIYVVWARLAKTASKTASKPPVSKPA